MTPADIRKWKEKYPLLPYEVIAALNPLADVVEAANEYMCGENQVRPTALYQALARVEALKP